MHQDREREREREKETKICFQLTFRPGNNLVRARLARNIANIARRTRVAFRQEPQTTFRSYETIPLKFQARSAVVPLAREFLIDLQDARRTFARHSIDSGHLSLVYRHAAECDLRDASCVLYICGPLKERNP